MMNKALIALKFKNLSLGISYIHRFGLRTILSQAYPCTDGWNKRLDSPLLVNVVMDKHFVEIDKKFNNNKPVSGVDIDLFANNVQNEDQLEEMEHLLYRFRKTKYAAQMMDSTIYAVIKAYLKFKDYDSLLHILDNQENYGIFPDFYSYNYLMDTFIRESMFKEATKVAINMMLQEEFSNEISCYLALYSCQMFLKEGSIESLYQSQVAEEAEKKEGDQEEEEQEEEETLVRVHYLRNPFFDDHFHLTNPQHLIGKTLFLIGRHLNKDILGQTYHLLGLGMYEKWNMALDFMNSISKLEDGQLLSEGVEEFKKYMSLITDEELKKQVENLLEKLHQSNKIKAGELEQHLKSKLEDISTLEKRDIDEQLELFDAWENERQTALDKQNLQLEKERRLAEIAKKKEYLFWKEKALFFFEKERSILKEFEQAKEVTESLKSKQLKDDAYVPPESLKKPEVQRSKYDKLIHVKTLK